MKEPNEEGMKRLIAAFLAVRGYCKSHGNKCGECAFKDKNVYCIFGGVTPKSWEMPEVIKKYV